MSCGVEGLGIRIEVAEFGAKGLGVGVALGLQGPV